MNSTLYYNRACAKDALGECQLAIVDYGKAIEIEPMYISAYNNRGGDKIKLGDIGGAVDDFNKVIALRPDYFAAYANLGRVYLLRLDWPAALKNIREALRLDPDDISLHIFVWLAQSRSGGESNATIELSSYLKSLSIAKDGTWPMRMLAPLIKKHCLRRRRMLIQVRLMVT